ncbi:carbonic anhydrase [Glutamicibacter arilaitensis]|uniref:carbonic anhydrase n=1 Tax=Glutamicibacter arilaitensis TaxID=256701 RepID=UPI003FD02BA5
MMPQPEPRFLNRQNPTPAGPSRRGLLAGSSGLIALAGLAACASPQAPETGRANLAGPPQTPDEVLQVLRAGNQRYADGMPEHPNQATERRNEQAEHQNPFALIHGCVDSRVTPELLFDQGIGDLFVTRTAGGVLDGTLVGSMEFAVSSPYSVPLLVILGHAACGAVAGTLKAMEEDAKNPQLPGEMVDFAEQIVPVARRAKVEGSGSEEVDHVVQANARAVTAQLLKRSAIIREAVQEKRTRVVAAVYDLDSGEVRWLDG